MMVVITISNGDDAGTDRERGGDDGDYYQHDRERGDDGGDHYQQWRVM